VCPYAEVVKLGVISRSRERLSMCKMGNSVYEKINIIILVIIEEFIFSGGKIGNVIPE